MGRNLTGKTGKTRISPIATDSVEEHCSRSAGFQHGSAALPIWTTDYTDYTDGDEKGSTTRVNKIPSEQSVKYGGPNASGDPFS